MTPADLRNWRKARALTQSQAAKRINVTLRTWQRYEVGESEIPASLIAYCETAPAEAPPADAYRIGDVLAESTANGGVTGAGSLAGSLGAGAPLSEADLVAEALHMMQQYIDGMTALPDKYGTALSYQWAVSYWFDGAMIAPLVYYGGKGVTPCAAAYRAANAKLQQAYQDGALWRMLARLDECPVHIKARV